MFCLFLVLEQPWIVEVSLPVGDLSAPFQPTPLCDSMIFLLNLSTGCQM